MIATILLSYYVVTREGALSGYSYSSLYTLHHSPHTASTASSTGTGAGTATLVFAYYCLFIHILVSLFPIRACYSIFNITSSLRKTARSKTLRDIKMSHRRRGSSTSLSSSETLTSSRDGSALSSSTSSEAGDLEHEQFADGDSASIDTIVHAIIIPNYKEEVDSLRETLDVLASHPQARHSYDVSCFLPLHMSWFSFSFFICSGVARRNRMLGSSDGTSRSVPLPANARALKKKQI